MLVCSRLAWYDIKMSEEIDVQKVVDFWQESAQRNFETAEFLFQGKKYADCLFYCHLAIEKIFKGLVVKKINAHAPFSHSLLDLAKLAGLELDEQKINHLIEITGFNIAGRYDDYKFGFYKKCDQEYAEKYFKISKEIYLWLKQ